jgi:MFS family permease
MSDGSMSMHSRLYRQYVTMLLLLVYVFNHLDRRVFDILMEPIKQAFSLTDTELAFLGGPALVVLYSLLGVPVARWADRGRRVRIMAAAIALWSAVAALTATAHDFWGLALARIGVGIGEAGFSAVAISVISDYEDDSGRPRALSRFMLASPIAALLSNLMGGWVNELYGWRPVFLIAGLPGLLLAVLMGVTVREPARRLASAVESRERPSLRSVFRILWQRRSLRHLALAQGLSNVALNSMGWLGVLFIRRYHLSTGELGSWLALSDGVIGCASIWLSGYLIARFASHDARLKTLLLAGASLLVAPLALFVIWFPSMHLALVGYLLLNFPMLFYSAPTAALVQELVGANIRATVAAIFFLIQMLVGAFVANQLIGALSDLISSTTADSTLGLRISMTLGVLFTLGAALHFWWAGRFVREDLASLRERSETRRPLEQAHAAT